MIAGARTSILKVGGQGISLVDAEIINQLIFSPLIQVLNSTHTGWATITINKSTPVIDNGESLQSVEFEFNLPSKAVQNV
jgi:hypothetical protein